MLQQPWEGVYNCSAQESTEGEYTKCTVVIRKRQISDDIIEKQSFLIQKMKQDNVFIKRLLETKSAEVSKMKVTIELLQSQKTELYQQLEKVRKNQQDALYLQAENQRLRNQNQELRIEIQSERVYIEQPFKAKIQELTEHIQSLKGQNQFLVQMSKHEDNRPQQNFSQLQRRCRQLKEELDRQRLMNEKMRKNLQRKLTSSQPIKIIQGTYQADAHQNFDEVKGTIQMGFHRKIGSDQLDNSLGRSRKQSDILFHDSENSYEESDRPVNRSVAYQKSEAEIQTQRWENYESGLISRQKIEKSFNQKRNNHHMKPLDQHTRIMNLSKELNEKDKTIKELQKKVQKQKKNGESVKKKLKEKEKQLKHLKKERSLTREHGVEEDADKSRKEEQITEKARNAQQAKEKVKAKYGYQEKITSQERYIKQNYQIEQQSKVIVSERLKEEIIIQNEKAEESQKAETNIKMFNQQNRKGQYQEQVNQNIIQIKQETTHKQVIVQTYSEKHQLEKDRVQTDNNALLHQIQNLKQKIHQLQSQNMKDRQKYQSVIQHYKEDELNIRISEKHDEDSFTEPNNQLARLRQQNETLRQQLKQYTDNELIPFHEVQEQTHFREVVTQTVVQKEAESETQANLNWDQVIEKLQSDDRKRKSEQQANKAPENEAKGNNFFSDLMSGLLGGNTETGKETEENKKEQTEQQLQVQIHKEVQFNVRVSQKHDEDSYTEPTDELTKLRQQVEVLRQQLRQYTDNEPIPFHEVQEQTHLREVVTQTSRHKETQSQARQTSNWDQVITKIQNDDRKRKAEEQANKVSANEPKSNNFFADLMSGLLGGNTQTGREIDENKKEEEVQQQLLSDVDKYNEIQSNVKVTQDQQVQDLPKSKEQKTVSYPTFAVSQPKQKRNQLRKQSNEAQSIQTPKFEEPLRNINLFASIQKQNFLKIEQTGDQIRQKLAEELALKQEELATLTSKMQWLEQKLLKYKKIIWKSKKYLIDTAHLRDPDEMVQIDIEEEEVLLSEVQTQTNPYMFSEEGIKKYTEELEFKLQQEEKISNGLRAKLKRWQNVIKKMHYEGDQINEDIQDLEIEEENIQLCEVQIQVNLNNQDKTEKNQEEVGRVKMKQLVLSGIQNLKKCVGDDSEEGQSENYSDRGRNTKRSVGSDEEQRGKISHQKMLEAEINHIYKDTQSILKKYQFKIQEDINIDNFKDTLDNFVSFIKRETFHTGIKYNSFEDIKQQENDDSLIEKEKRSSQKGGSANLLQQHYDHNTHKTSEKVHKQKQSILPMQILYIEKQSILAHSGPTFELNPLFISEVSYKPINKSSYNDLVLKMTELKGGEISKVIECFVEELQMLRNKLTDLGELQLSSCEEVIKVCGFDNLAKFIGH